MKKLIYALFAALLTGCAATTFSDLSKSHPASPQAPGSSEPTAAPMLMAGSQGLVLPVATNQTEMHHGQHQHTPSGKSAQQPAQQKHEHEHKKEEKK